MTEQIHPYYSRLVKCEESNDRSQLILGATTTLSARDAEVLPALNMMLLLDMASNLVLYSGLVKVSCAIIEKKK